MFKEHVSWPKGVGCRVCRVEHPSHFFAYEGCLPDGSGKFGPVCGEVAQGRYAEFEHLGFFDLGRTHPWQDSWPSSSEAEVKRNG